MDNRVLKSEDRPFEAVWPDYSYAPLTRLVLNVAERWHVRRKRRQMERPDVEPAITISRQLAP